MTKKFKRTLFITAFLFFLVSAPTLIFYSQGYRFDFANKKIVKTGGLFLKVSPPGVNIYIDHNLSNKTNFFFDSAFIDGLTPKKYQITIKKDGYYNWTKTLSVKEKQVSEAKNILLADFIFLVARYLCIAIWSEPAVHLYQLNIESAAVTKLALPYGS